MKKGALVLATLATLAGTAMTAPAQARGLGVVSGVIAGAIAAGVAADIYGYGPRYDYYGTRYDRQTYYGYGPDHVVYYGRHRGWRYGW